ncbi:TPA: hypothetical protein ACH3X1_007761 [Trebouxia sp. C0004]
MGKRTFFNGMNTFDILVQKRPESTCAYVKYCGGTDDDIDDFFMTQAEYEQGGNLLLSQTSSGINLIRFFGSINGEGAPEGYGSDSLTERAILKSINKTTLQGVYNEFGLQRFDLVLSYAEEAGVYCIVVLVNGEQGGTMTHPAIAGGMQWYVDQVLGNGSYGSGGSYNLFYTDPDVKQAFKFYITTILNRTNTLSGRLYKEDPSVFSWELANEATSTLDQTGEAVAAWASEMAAHIRSLDAHHMISTGELGYDIQPGQTKDQCNPCADPTPATAADQLTQPNFFNISRNAINAGDSGQGTSFSLNTAIANISFGTIHAFPEDMGVPFSTLGDRDNYTWVEKHFIQPRAAQAAALGKPFILEEVLVTKKYGNLSSYSIDSAQEVAFNFTLQAAVAAGAAAILTEPLSSLSLDGRSAQIRSGEDVEIDMYWDVLDLMVFRICLDNASCNASDYANHTRKSLSLSSEGPLCDVGSEAWSQCGYCNLNLERPGVTNTPLNCTTQIVGGYKSKFCQDASNWVSCAATCLCIAPDAASLNISNRPYPVPPGCQNLPYVFNGSSQPPHFSKHDAPPAGCTCCDYGFGHLDSCARQAHIGGCNDPAVKASCMCTCGFCKSRKHSRVKVGLSVGMAILGVIIAILLGVWITRRHMGYAGMTTAHPSSDSSTAVPFGTTAHPTLA